MKPYSKPLAVMFLEVLAWLCVVVAVIGLMLVLAGRDALLGNQVPDSPMGLLYLVFVWVVSPGASAFIFFASAEVVDLLGKAAYFAEMTALNTAQTAFNVSTLTAALNPQAAEEPDYTDEQG